MLPSMFAARDVNRPLREKFGAREAAPLRPVAAAGLHDLDRILRPATRACAVRGRVLARPVSSRIGACSAMRERWAMSFDFDPLERVGFMARYLSPRPRRVRQATRVVVAAIVVIGFLREETPWEILVLALWVGVYVELMMRRPDELGGRPW